MNKSVFRLHLDKATDTLLEFMRSLIIDEVPDNCLYHVCLDEPYYASLVAQNSPSIGTPFTTPVNGFPSNASQLGLVRSLSSIDVSNVLYIDGAIPLWINMELHSVDEQYAYIKLGCSERMIVDDSQLYHLEEGYPPFHVLSGFLPAGWKSVEQSGKFSLRRK